MFNPTTSVLILVDYQTRLLPSIHNGESVVDEALFLAKLTRILDIPIFGTEQNPEGLGPNDRRIRGCCDQTLLKFSFDATYENIICKNEPPKLPNISDNEKLIIDMGDHNIRYASMFMNVIVHICNHELKTGSVVKHQLYAILNNIKPHNIKPVSDLREYMRLLEKNTNMFTQAEYIPLLSFATRDSDRDYKRYFTIILDIMLRIIDELKSLGRRPLNYFCPLESIVLYYMIESIEQGRYQALTINDVYNIIDVYSKVFDPSSQGHNHCKCKSQFPIGTINLNDTQRKQQAYLHAHYERLSHICAILDGFVSEHHAVNWLYEHPVEYTGIDNDDFSIKKRHPLIGYDGKNIYIFNILPQFTELNFNEFITKSIYDTWLIQNVDKDSPNYNRFREKSITSYVLSLNRKELYSVNWTNAISENRNFIVNSIYDTVLNKYSMKHEQYYNSFVSVIKANDGNIKNILKECTKDIDKAAKYISKFWISLEGKIGECSSKKAKQDLLTKYSEKGTFMEFINGYLDRSLMDFLGMTDEEEGEELNVITHS